MLARLLGKLKLQRTDGLFTYSVLVVDNDEVQSAWDTVVKARADGVLTIAYRVAPEKNVAVARNVAVENACGTFLAFIDDDEYPIDDWLLALFRTLVASEADGVLGPVRAVFDEAPPDWIVKAKLFERPSHGTGTVLSWNQTRTGNVLFRMRVFDGPDHRFNPAFKHSEDRDFFRRMTAKGLVFVWCNDAVVYETETADRFRRAYFLRRALVRGNAAMRHYGFRKQAVARSALAVLLYAAALPVLLFAGHHLFMRYSIKLCDHVGALLAVAKVDLIGRFGGA
jgi:glycosyltransferase involved in cell wall biosynthesis